MICKLMVIWCYFGIVIYNFGFIFFFLYIVCQVVLRFWGVKIGFCVGIFCGMIVFGIKGIEIGDNSMIGFWCLFDGCGGLMIGVNVVIVSDVQFIVGYYLFDIDDFDWIIEVIWVEDFVWIVSCFMVFEGFMIGWGVVIGVCLFVCWSVFLMIIVVGIFVCLFCECYFVFDYVMIY